MALPFRRARATISRLRASLWLLPALMTAGAVVLSMATVAVDARIDGAQAVRNAWFVFDVGADGVRTVLGVIAGGVMTVTGVVFSITVVALQLASTQYSPRVLRTFLLDRSNHVVLGVFIATFTYALIVLRTVRSASGSVTEFVPSLSVTIAMFLGLLSVACLIFFVHHIAQSIRASVIVERLTADAVEIARRDFPRNAGEPVSAPDEFESAAEADVGELPEFPVVTARHGYLELVDDDALAALEPLGPMAIHMEGSVGDYFRTGDAVARVRAPAGAEREAIATAVRAALPLGTEPTGPQDINLGITRLSDVAVRALSPAINDPATACSCLDGLSEVLTVLGNVPPTPRARRIAPRVMLHVRYPEFAEMASLAFAPVRHYGSGDPRVVVKLLNTALAVARRVPDNARAVLRHEAELTARAAERALPNEDERAYARGEAERIVKAIAVSLSPAGR